MREPRAVEQKSQAKQRRSETVDSAWLVQKDGYKADREQPQRKGENLPPGEAAFDVLRRQHDVSRAGVILTVHPGDAEKMGELPQEQQGVEDPSLQAQAAARRRPADQGWHGARKSPDQRAQRRPSLQGGVKREITSQREQGEEARQRVHGQSQVESASGTQQDPEP